MGIIISSKSNILDSEHSKHSAALVDALIDLERLESALVEFGYTAPVSSVFQLERE